MKIVTDSTADLSKDLVEKLGVTIVPLTIHLGDKSWTDYYDIEPDAYYAMLRSSKAFPTTAQPSPQDFIDAFAPHVTKGEPILSIHLTGRLSGTYQSALLARSRFPEARIEVIDSLSSSMGLAMMVLACTEQASQGASFETVVESVRQMVKRMETFFSVDSLEYLRRGGRIGKAQALVGTLMKIKPILKVVDGEVHPYEKVRTTEKLLDRYVELVESAVLQHGPVRVALTESDNGSVMDTLVERLEKIPGVSLVFRGKSGGVITSHVGPGLLGLAFMGGPF
jgi:DegV family protein with EDD domain